MWTDDLAFDVLCYGTVSIESATRLPYLPTPRRDVAASSEYDELGGEALRVAVSLSTWGLRVRVVGNAIGTDRKGQYILSELARHPSIDARYIRQDPDVVTPFSRLLVTPDGERSRIAYWYDQTPKTELLPSMARGAKVLSVDAYGHEERDRAAAIAAALGQTVIAADAIRPEHPLAGLSDVVVISSIWLHANFPAVYEYDHALELQKRGTGVVIITDGPRAVLVVRADGSAFGIEPYEVKGVVDTSGAGDLFKAGIIYGWLQQDWPLEQKVKFACAAAGLYCALDRTTKYLPTLSDIFALMRAQPR